MENKMENKMEIDDLKNGDLLDFDKTFAYYSKKYPDAGTELKDLVKGIVDGHNVTYLAPSIEDVSDESDGFEYKNYASISDQYTYHPLLIITEKGNRRSFKTVIQVLVPFEGEDTSVEYISEINTEKGFCVVKLISIEQYKEIIDKKIKALEALAGFQELDSKKSNSEIIAGL